MDEIAFGLYSRMTTTRQLHAEQRCRVDDDDQVMSCVSAVVLHRGFIRTYIIRGAHERDASADVTTGVNVLQDLGTDRDSADCEHAQQISSWNQHYSKYVFPNRNRTQAAEIELDLQTRPSDEGPSTSSVSICRKSVERFRDIRWKPRFLSMVTLTFDLDIQTHPSEGPNTPSLWIWCKSVQRFPRYFIHEQKSHRERQKQNLTQFTACGNKVTCVTFHHKQRVR